MNKKTPMVSVIMPVFNAAETLPDALESLLGQSFTNFEVICIDDGSFDASQTILEDYSGRDSRIQLITTVHQGAGAARNTGLEAASGRYLAFLDADDKFSEDALEVLVSAAIDNKLDVVLGGISSFEHGSDKLVHEKQSLRLQEMPEKRPFSAKKCADKIFNLGSVSPSCKLWRRTFIVSSGVRFQELPSCNDMFFTQAALASARRISTVDSDVLYQRRKGPMTLAAPIEEHPLSSYYALKALKDYLDEHELYDYFEQSFANWALDYSIGLANLFGGHFGALLKQQMRRVGFREFGILDRSPDYFYYPKRYEEFKRIMQDYKSLEDLTSVKPVCSLVYVATEASGAGQARVALESAVNQTVENIEIICLTDPVNSEVTSMVNSFAEEDSRVRIAPWHEGGVSPAFKSALSDVKGKYIAFLVGDDFLDPCFLEVALAKFDEPEFEKCRVVRTDMLGVRHNLDGRMRTQRIQALTRDDDYRTPISPVDLPKTLTNWLDCSGFLCEKSLFTGYKPNAYLSWNLLSAYIAVYILAKADAVACVNRSLYITQRDNLTGNKEELEYKHLFTTAKNTAFQRKAKKVFSTVAEGSNQESPLLTIVVQPNESPSDLHKTLSSIMGNLVGDAALEVWICNPKPMSDDCAKRWCAYDSRIQITAVSVDSFEDNLLGAAVFVLNSGDEIPGTRLLKTAEMLSSANVDCAISIDISRITPGDYGLEECSNGQVLSTQDHWDAVLGILGEGSAYMLFARHVFIAASVASKETDTIPLSFDMIPFCTSVVLAHVAPNEVKASFVPSVQALNSLISFGDALPELSSSRDVYSNFLFTLEHALLTLFSQLDFYAGYQAYCDLMKEYTGTLKTILANSVATPDILEFLVRSFDTSSDFGAYSRFRDYVNNKRIREIERELDRPFDVLAALVNTGESGSCTVRELIDLNGRLARQSQRQKMRIRELEDELVTPLDIASAVVDTEESGSLTVAELIDLNGRLARQSRRQKKKIAELEAQRV